MTEPLTSKGAPVVETVETVARTVVLRLGNCSRTSDGMGNTFLPEELEMEWRNGALIDVVLAGPRLRLDGNPWVVPQTSYRSYVPMGGNVVATDTPDWVVRLIEQYRPV